MAHIHGGGCFCAISIITSLKPHHSCPAHVLQASQGVSGKMTAGAGEKINNKKKIFPVTKGRDASRGRQQSQKVDGVLSAHGWQYPQRLAGLSRLLSYLRRCLKVHRDRVVWKRKNKTKKTQHPTHWCSVFDIKMNQPPYKHCPNKVEAEFTGTTDGATLICRRASDRKQILCWGGGRYPPYMVVSSRVGFFFCCCCSWKWITYQCIQVDVGPLNLLGLSAILDHGPA